MSNINGDVGSEELDIEEFTVGLGCDPDLEEFTTTL